MVMKDKLVRHNHKKSYFFFKKTIGVSSCIFGAFILLAVPVSIIRSVIEEPKVEESSNETNKFIDNSIAFENELLKL